MKRALCVVLALVCVFVFNSSGTATRKADENTTVLEKTTPESEITPPQEGITTETTSASNDVDPPQKSEHQLVVEAIIGKLAMFESVFLPDSREWCIYDDVMGSSVTEVLSKQSLLIAAGCNEADVYLAGEATENLRALLEGYNDLRTKEYRTDYDKYMELYRYYSQHYDALTQNFCDLYKTLSELYKNERVSTYVGLRGKAIHYRQLLGQLYVVSTAFDADTERDEEAWQIDEKRLNEVIEDIHYFPDGDWYPEELY